MKKITINEVAKVANVSIATVSRVINGDPKVLDSTRKKVLKVVQELGYSSEPYAKRLALKKDLRIGVVVSSRIKGLIEDSTDEFYNVILRSIHKHKNRERCKIEECLPEDLPTKEFDGIIILGSELKRNVLKDFLSSDKPVVLVDHYEPGLDIDSIVTDGYGGAIKAVNYLLMKGMKRIVHIHGPLERFGFKNRFDGYIAAMEKAGYIPKAYEANDVIGDMGTLVRYILATYGKPDGIFVSNDYMAMKVIEGLKSNDLRVPDDISVIGFDDIIAAELFDPPLTTVKTFKIEMGYLAMERLLDKIFKESVHPVRISLFSELVIRKSTR